MVYGDPRISKAQAAVDEACNREAETGYEVEMRDLDCKASYRNLQQTAWTTTVDIWRTTQLPGTQITKPGMDRESDILIQLFTEASHKNNNPWWLPAAE